MDALVGIAGTELAAAVEARVAVEEGVGSRALRLGAIVDNEENYRSFNGLNRSSRCRRRGLRRGGYR